MSASLMRLLFNRATKGEHVVVVCADGRAADAVRADVAHHALETGQAQATRHITTITATRGMQRLHGAPMALVVADTRLTAHHMQQAREFADWSGALFAVWDPV